jgi:hypothetical protein
MTEKTHKVGDVVAWTIVDDGTMVLADMSEQGKFYAVKHHGRGEWVGPNEGWTSFTGPWSWPWSPAPLSLRGEVTIIAMGLTGQETAADLQRLAEVFEVREALLATPCVACMGEAVCWGYCDVEPELQPMCDKCCYHSGEDGWCTLVRDDLQGLAARLHREGWKAGEKVLRTLTADGEREHGANSIAGRPGDTAERAAELLRGAP